MQNSTSKKLTNYKHRVTSVAGHIESCADYMPHENRVVLPPCQSKTEIYEMYRDELAKLNLRTVSRSQFKKMWRRYFKNVVIRKVNSF